MKTNTINFKGSCSVIKNIINFIKKLIYTKKLIVESGIIKMNIYFIFSSCNCSNRKMTDLNKNSSNVLCVYSICRSKICDKIAQWMRERNCGKILSLYMKWYSII